MGFKSGPQNKVKNQHSKQVYVVSTAREVVADYWSTGVFPAGFLGFPKLSKMVASFIRNSEDEAHRTHNEVCAAITQFPEAEWLTRFPKPLPDVLTPGAEKRLRR